jgi:biotin transporter BioY
MGPFLTSFLFAAGVGAWVYNKSQQRNGGLAQQSAIAAGVVAVVALIVFYTIFSAILSRLPA